MEEGIVFATGAGLLPIGLSYLIRGKDWRSWLKALGEHGHRASLMLGMTNVLIGGLIVGFHWKWEGLPLVLSMVGALALLKGSVYLLFPAWLPMKLKWLEPHYRLVLPLSGIIAIALSLAILCEWQKSAFPHYDWRPTVWIQ